MKTITIRFTDLEAAMLIELKRKNKSLRDFQRWVADKLRLNMQAMLPAYDNIQFLSL